MKEFLAIYLGSPDSQQGKDWNALDESARQARQAAGMKAWHGWMDANKAAIVVMGVRSARPSALTPRASRTRRTA